MPNTISKFEHLPNELLLDFFSYCRPRDLFISLFNLNQRLNNLIYIQSLNVDLGNALPKYLLDLYYKSVLFNARDQIHTLRLSDTYGRMRRFISSNDSVEIDFITRQTILSQLKYLILWDPMMSSLHDILEHVNNLEYFQVTSIGRARQTPNYSDGLLNKLFQMKHLKRLSLALHDSVSFTPDLSTNTSLTHLTLNGCHMQHLAPLLRRLPNLRRLNVMCYNRSNLFGSTAENFDYSLYDGIADCVPHLTHLILHVTHTPFFEIEALLCQLPQLIKLSFSSLLIENYSNGSNWERLITTRLLHLEKFSLFINETHISPNFHFDFDFILQAFSSLFWQQWPIVLEYCREANQRQNLMLYTLPTQKDSVRTYFYNVETFTSREKLECTSEQEKRDYKKMTELHLTLHSNSISDSILPSRVYSNLKSLSFSSQLTIHHTYHTEKICTDLKKICSSCSLENIKRIYLYDRIYPKDFLSSLLSLLPNIQSLRVGFAAMNISTAFPRITSLTIDFHTSNPSSVATDVLHRIGTFLPNIRYLYIELNNCNDIYIVLIYFLRKLVHLLDVHVTLNDSSAHFDQDLFVQWFNEFKSFDRLSDRVQVEFSDENNRLHISL